jgi:catechol 2,3-dioxygenase-like lactoylglutathione lyase family enzyme
MNILQVDHIGIEVAELKRAERFYTQVLGFEVFMRLPDQLLLQCGPQRVALFENRSRKPAGLSQLDNPRGKAHHAFLVSKDDLWSAKTLFETRRVPFHAPIDWGDHHCLYFLDPDENLLELVHAPMTAAPSRSSSSLPSKARG